MCTCLQMTVTRGLRGYKHATHPYDHNKRAIRQVKTNNVENERYRKKLQRVWADEYEDINNGPVGCEARELNYTQNYFFRPHRLGMRHAGHGVRWRNLSKMPVRGMSEAESVPSKPKNPSLGSC